MSLNLMMVIVLVAVIAYLLWVNKYQSETIAEAEIVSRCDAVVRESVKSFLELNLDISLESVEQWMLSLLQSYPLDPLVLPDYLKERHSLESIGVNDLFGHIQEGIEGMMIITLTGERKSLSGGFYYQPLHVIYFELPDDQVLRSLLWSVDGSSNRGVHEVLKTGTGRNDWKKVDDKESERLLVVAGYEI